MKLKVQSMFIIGLSMILFLAFLILVTRPMLIKDAVELDHHSIEMNMKSFKNYINREKDRLNRLSIDWAVWDDTYEFINGESTNYIERNLVSSNFPNLNIAYMLFFDNRTQYVYGKGVKPVDSELKDFIQNLILTNDYQEEAYIVRTPRGLAFVDVEKVFPSNGEGPSNGSFVTIRFIDKKFITLLEKELSINVIGYDHVSRITPPSNEIQTVNNHKLQGSLYLNEVNSGEYSQFVLEHNREYYLQKSAGINNLFITFLIMILLFIAVIYVLLDRLILSRVTTLSMQLRAIQKSKNISNRLSHSRNNKDEIYVLERAVNGMLYSLEESQDEIKRLAYQDFLTSLPNRYRLQHDFDFFVQSSEKIAVLFLDLDGFKGINDSFGHAAGNLLLIEVANRLTTLIDDEAGMVSRIGGDEFIILIQDKDRIELQEFGQLITKTISEPYTVNEMEMQITTSLGISQMPEDGHSFEELVNHADTAMYESKRNGKNQIAFYNNEEQIQLVFD
ncbi:MAG: diguanylate cyclase domain-containing protein [Paenisporosarcina sp.]